MERWPVFQLKNQQSSRDMRRALGAFFVILGICGYFIFELFNITILKNKYYLALAKNQQIITTEVSPKRGIIFATDILEKDSKAVLAESVERFALGVTPKNVPKKNYNKLATIIDPYTNNKDQNQIIEVFKKDSMYAPPLIHGLTKSQVQEITNKINSKVDINFDKSAGDIIYFVWGVIFFREYERQYPEEQLASHILGYVDSEGNGKYGIEGLFNAELQGTKGIVASEKDNSGEILDKLGTVDRQNGINIVLTIDRNIQNYIETRLKKAIEDYKAESGSIIVMDPKTGEIVSMASLPDFNPNEFKKTSIGLFLNPCISKQYEAGSAMKPFTVSAALDLGLVNADTKNNFSGSISIGSYIISNVYKRAYPNSDVRGILDNSINTGTVWLADQIGNENLYKYLSNFGFGQKTNINLPGEIKGNLPDGSKWRTINRATISFGQGDAITPLQIANGYAAIANGGNLMEPMIVKEKILPSGKRIQTKPKIIRRVISENTALELRKMLKHIVDFGHSKKAAIEGYEMGGKTGTAQIPLPDGTYSEDVTNQTFMGIGPVSNPKFVIAVILHKPNTKFADGSTTFVFKDIAQFLINYWQVSPL